MRKTTLLLAGLLLFAAAESQAHGLKSAKNNARKGKHSSTKKHATISKRTAKLRRIADVSLLNTAPNSENAYNPEPYLYANNYPTASSSNVVSYTRMLVSRPDRFIHSEKAGTVTLNLLVDANGTVFSAERGNCSPNIEQEVIEKCIATVLDYKYSPDPLGNAVMNTTVSFEFSN